MPKIRLQEVRRSIDNARTGQLGIAIANYDNTGKVDSNNPYKVDSSTIVSLTEVIPIATNVSDGLMSSDQASKLQALSSLTSVLTIKKVTETDPENTDGFNIGDVWINSKDNIEYVVVEVNNTKQWVELGPVTEGFATQDSVDGLSTRLDAAIAALSSNRN